MHARRQFQAALLLRRELRPLLTNLKILDWVVAAVRGGQAINDRAFMGLTALIDALWERRVEDGGRLDRSHLLMRLGTIEAASLGTGVPRMELATADQSALAALPQGPPAPALTCLMAMPPNGARRLAPSQWIIERR